MPDRHLTSAAARKLMRECLADRDACWSLTDRDAYQARLVTLRRSLAAAYERESIQPKE